MDKMTGGQLEGGRAVLPGPLQRIYDWLLPNRSNMPPKVREMIKRFGQHQVVGVTVCRKPVNNKIQAFLNFISKNGLAKGIAATNYDDVYHLYLFMGLKKIGTDDSALVTVIFERNHVIDLRIGKVDTRDIINVPHEKVVQKAIPFAEFVDNAVQVGLKKNRKSFFEYDVAQNNCQDFALVCLEANGLLTPDIAAFIKQDIEAVMMSSPAWGKPLVDAVTDFANRLDRAVYGEGQRRQAEKTKRKK